MIPPVRARGDHPRVCGEHCGEHSASFGVLGSSPRMRGTHSRCRRAANVTGIIPAYAGNTRPSSSRPVPGRDHPRVCGEHHCKKRIDQGQTGSSPRMRGTPTRASYCSRPAGIIPAYAGNTPAACWKSWQAWDHPRVCGEHDGADRTLSVSTGSSPRMRGTQVFCDDLSTRLGIIPAYAGNTLKCATMYTWVRDHPRVCGEHAHRNDNGTNDMGSSPRMRGTHPDIFVCADTKGIIPAYAGNTEPPTASQPLNRDHPRVCGEHPSINGVHPLSGGSSPRMRGTLTSGCDVSIRIGIIPAYAGNTARCSRMSLGSRDHPRVCGEHEDTRL